MAHKSVLWYFIVLGLFFFACDNSGKQNSSDVIPGMLDSTQIPEPPLEIESAINDSLFLDTSWEIQTILQNGSIQQDAAWKGSIVQFNSDGSYIWKGNGFEYNGQWQFDKESALLGFSAQKDGPSSEWTVKHKRGFMVWVGTATFGQNNLQMSLIRKANQL